MKEMTTNPLREGEVGFSRGNKAGINAQQEVPGTNAVKRER